MIQFTCADIEMLRLIGWCKDVPVQTGALLSQECLKLFQILGLLRTSKSLRSYRLTQEGYRLLSDCGFDLPQDKYPVGAGRVLERRLQTAAGMMMFYRSGIEVFLRDMDDFTGKAPEFLPSFALRQKQSISENILGATRFLGLLIIGDYLYIPYYLQTGKERFIPHTEMAVAKAVSSLCSRIRRYCILFISEKPEYLVPFLLRINKQKKVIPIAESINAVPYPVYLIPANENGVRQLQMMLVREYREKLLELSSEAIIVCEGRKDYDAIIRKDGSPFVIGVDLDIKRLLAAQEIAKQENRILHVLCFDFQKPILEHLIKGSKFLPLKESEVNKALGLNGTFFYQSNTPFITSKGQMIDDNFFRKDTA